MSNLQSHVQKKVFSRAAKRRKKVKHWKGVEPDHTFWGIVFELEKKRFYALKTLTPEEDVHTILSGNGQHDWVKMFKPVRVAEIKDLKTLDPEMSDARFRALLFRFMGKYGVERIRGGEFSQVSGSLHVKAIARYSRELPFHLPCHGVDLSQRYRLIEDSANASD